MYNETVNWECISTQMVTQKTSLISYIILLLNNPSYSIPVLIFLVTLFLTLVEGVVFVPYLVMSKFKTLECVLRFFNWIVPS